MTRAKKLNRCYVLSTESDGTDISMTKYTSPVKIAWPGDSHSGISVNLQPLCNILKSPSICDLPVVIVSVNGTTRQGKSFFLNQAVKYLTHLTSDDNDNDEDWINKELSTCFEWTCTHKSVTEGIHIWPSPFILSAPGESDQKLALILMDNQGLNGTNSGCNEENKLYVLSNLISSLFIYFKNSEGRKYLEELQVMLQYSMAIQFDTGSQIQDPEKRPRKPFRFGHLLIRFGDFRWKNEFPLENGCSIYDSENLEGRVPAQDLYEHCFRAPSDNENVIKIRERILECYDSVTLATTAKFLDEPTSLRPGDGEEIWTPDFLTGQKKLIEHVFSFPFLWKSRKKIYGEELTAQQLVPLIENWGRKILEPDYNTRHVTNYEANVKVLYDSLIEQSMSLYMSEFARFKENPRGKFGKWYEDTESLIKERFWDKCKYQVNKPEYWKQFEQRIGQQVRHDEDTINNLLRQKRKKEKMGAGIVGGAGGVMTVAGTAAAIAEPASIAAAAATMAVGGVLVAVPLGIFGVWWYMDWREKRAIDKIVKKSWSTEDKL